MDEAIGGGNRSGAEPLVEGAEMARLRPRPKRRSLHWIVALIGVGFSIVVAMFFIWSMDLF